MTKLQCCLYQLFSSTQWQFSGNEI